MNVAKEIINNIDFFIYDPDKSMCSVKWTGNINKNSIFLETKSCNKCNKNEIDGNIYPEFDTIKNKARNNSNLNVYGNQFRKEYDENSISEIQEFIGNSRNIKWQLYQQNKIKN